MGQTFDIGLNAKINDFTKKYSIIKNNANEDQIFEDFVNYTISSCLLEEEVEDFRIVSTNKAKGIDGIGILVNNYLINEKTALSKIDQLQSLRIKICFIQSTTSKSFNEQKLKSFTDEVINFLTEALSIEPFSTIYKELFDENGTYMQKICETPKLYLYFVSARTSHVVLEQTLNAEKDKIRNRKELEYRFDKSPIFEIFQAQEIKGLYDSIPKLYSVEMRFETNVQLPTVDGIEMSLLTTIKFSELKKLILTKDNELKDRLFIENVRTFIGNTSVNNKIINTLENEKDRQYFPYLNNGLTIMCDKIERHPVSQGIFRLTFPRIINGCQTTHMLYKAFTQDNDINNVELVAKVISTKNNALKKAIIYATNNQNSISEDLQSLNDFHEKIEIFFNGKEESHFQLYYERLRGQYSQITPPYCKIRIDDIARIYISVFKQEPNKMKSQALRYIKELQNNGEIFKIATEEEMKKYYYCGVLNYWYHYLFFNNCIQPISKTMDMHILMACDLFIGENNIDKKIEYITDKDNARIVFQQTTTFLNSKSYLFEKRGFYSKPKVDRLIGDIKDERTKG